MARKDEQVEEVSDDKVQVQVITSEQMINLKLDNIISMLETLVKK